MSTVLWHPKAERVLSPRTAGDFTGGGWKFLVHSAEGKSVKSCIDTVIAKEAEPHFVLGIENGKRRLVQMIPLNQAARALQHTFPEETNRANAIQVEVCEFAANAPHWSPELYRYLKLLFVWCHRHRGIPLEAHHPFTGQHGYHRLSPAGFVKASGLVGHCHVPGNDHTDPGNIHVGKVL